MNDKKEMSVNESLAKVNKILRSAGDLILPRETNIALSILADVACQQQEEIDELRERVSLSDRFIGGLNKHVQSQPQGHEPETLIPLGDIAAELLLAINEFGHTPISPKTATRARELFSNIENQAKALINENEILRNSAMQSMVTITTPISESTLKKEIKSNSFSTGQRIEVVNAVYEAIRRVGIKHGVSNCAGDEMRQILNAYFDISRKEI